MIQLDVRVKNPCARKFVGGLGRLTPTTYIQLAGAGSKMGLRLGESCKTEFQLPAHAEIHLSSSYSAELNAD